MTIVSEGLEFGIRGDTVMWSLRSQSDTDGPNVAEDGLSKDAGPVK